MRIQNVRDFAQTKPESEINAPFLSNEHGDPRFFLQVFAKNSLIKKIFKKEKNFDSRTKLFWKTVPYRVYFTQGDDFKVTTELSQNVHYSHNQEIKDGVNEAILFM